LTNQAFIEFNTEFYWKNSSIKLKFYLEYTQVFIESELFSSMGLFNFPKAKYLFVSEKKTFFISRKICFYSKHEA